MNHIPEDRLQAYVEAWLSPEERREVERHLEGCPACSAVHQELAALRSLARAAIGELHPAPDVEASWREVMQRVRRQRRRTHALAASFVVGLLAAISAFAPLSPFYGWAGRAWERIMALFADETRDVPVEVMPSVETESGPSPRPEADESTAALPSPTADAGVFLEATREPIRIALHDALPGTDIHVVLVDGTEAGVLGSAASRFSREPGRIDVSVRGASIRVEIPRRAEQVQLLVHGEVLLLKHGESLDVRGPVASRGPDEIRFLVPGG
ncbi:MAG: zf-HC2 domain-containing protein [Gammaproteobacteria bacterium]|nr:zf-HC2 domain-containing protein [Gammaproteobacteria bacterium]MDE0649227.1 zf-HC2 domain-containing protein [Gammaproteobacteria bacterium]